MLEVCNLSLIYGERRILTDLSFSATSGEVLALIGPNGAGKSTLLALIAGDIKPQVGQIKLAGRPLESYSTRELARLRSMLLQKTEVAFPYSVREVVEMGRTPWRGSPEASQDELIVDQAMKKTATISMAEREVTQLSGGESGRVHLARVLAQATPLILLDEPTAALDILHQEQTLITARKLAQEGAIVLVVLHDLDMAAAYADRVLLLKEGKLVALGSPTQVCTAESLSQVYGCPIEVLKHPLTGRTLILPQRDRQILT